MTEPGETYHSGIRGITCETCPLNGLSEEEWQRAAGDVSPFWAAENMTDALADSYSERTQSKYGTPEASAHAFIAVDKLRSDGWEELPDKEDPSKLEQRIGECMLRNEEGPGCDAPWKQYVHE